MGVFSGPLIHARGRAAVIRLILLIGLVAAVGWGFSARFEHHQTRIMGQHDVRDASDALSDAARDAVYALKRQLQTEFGLRTVITLGPVRADTVDPLHTLYIAIPETDDATVTLPRLVSKALPDGTPERLTQALRVCLKTASAGDCLTETLRAIQNGLRE